MLLTELEQSQKMPGHDLVGSFEGGIPIYKAQLKVAAQKKQSIPTMSQFALRLIDIGINTEDEIAKALGIGSEFARISLGYLDLNELIARRFGLSNSNGLSFVLSEKGKLAIRDALAATYITDFSVQVDGLTGEISDLDETLLNDSTELKKTGATPLHVTPGTKPTVETLTGDLTHLASMYSRQTEDPGADDQLIEILDVQRYWLKYKPVNILVFRNSTNRQIKLRVFEGYEPIPVYDERLTQRERNGGRVIPESMLIPAVDVGQPSASVLSLQPNVATLEQLDEELRKIENEKTSLRITVAEAAAPPSVITSRTKRLQEVEEELSTLKEKQARARIVRTSEHRQILKEALESAKVRVIIIAPWINADAVDGEILTLIKHALKRGVSIAIGYGMPDDRYEEAIRPKVARQFDEIQHLPEGNGLHLEWLRNTHAKILVCDERFSVVTSFNWLSYRGDRGFRQETGTYTEDPKLVKEAIREALTDFKSLPDGFTQIK